jgi:hypothetical protein
MQKRLKKGANESTPEEKNPWPQSNETAANAKSIN